MVMELNLQQLIETNGWLNPDKSTLSREGKIVDLSGDIWSLPYSVWRKSATTLDFTKIINHKLRWALKSYVMQRLQKVSTHAACSIFKSVYSEILRNEKNYSIEIEGEFKEQLILLFEDTISKARDNHRLWALYRPIQWYIFSAEHYPELGFCPAYALELEGMTIPGNPKGEAVRVDDPDSGPLHRTLELIPLISAMKKDNSKELLHLQQKAAIALSIAFGRNPANLTFLREEDLTDLTPIAESRCYQLKIPRIKKRQINPRDDFMDEYLEPLYAGYIMELIDKNAEDRIVLFYKGKPIPNPRPLFVNLKGNNSAISSLDFENAYNMTSADITNLVKGFVQRHNIMSRGERLPLEINTRRLRYTLATGLAAENISKRELARILDHTDTQHVLVYFEMAGKIVEHLDKAAAKGFSQYMQFFRGKIIDSDNEAINGDRDDKHILFVNEENPSDQKDIGVCGESKICHLDPPFSCYLCPKFQPYRHADHEHVLDCLIQSRDIRLKKYENARLGIQLDDVIAAVAQVSELCGMEVSNG